MSTTSSSSLLSTSTRINVPTSTSSCPMHCYFKCIDLRPTGRMCGQHCQANCNISTTTTTATSTTSVCLRACEFTCVDVGHSAPWCGDLCGQRCSATRTSSSTSSTSSSSSATLSATTVSSTRTTFTNSTSTTSNNLTTSSSSTASTSASSSSNTSTSSTTSHSSTTDSSTTGTSTTTPCFNDCIDTCKPHADGGQWCGQVCGNLCGLTSTLTTSSSSTSMLCRCIYQCVDIAESFPWCGNICDTGCQSTTSSTTNIGCDVSCRYPTSNCLDGLHNGQTCQAETWTDPCVEEGKLTFRCPDASKAEVFDALAPISLGEHWGKDAFWFPGGCGTFTRVRRQAFLSALEGGFDTLCRVCGIRDPVDTDLRRAFVSSSVSFGPNTLMGRINNTVVDHFEVLLVGSQNRLLLDGQPLAVVQVDNLIDEDGVEPANPCDCPRDRYEAHVAFEVPEEASQGMRIMVTVVTAQGNQLPIGPMTALLVDVWTTTSTTTTSTSTSSLISNTSTSSSLTSSSSSSSTTSTNSTLTSTSSNTSSSSTSSSSSSSSTNTSLTLSTTSMSTSSMTSSTSTSSTSHTSSESTTSTSASISTSSTSSTSSMSSSTSTSSTSHTSSETTTSTSPSSTTSEITTTRTNIGANLMNRLGLPAETSPALASNLLAMIIIASSVGVACLCLCGRSLLRLRESDSIVRAVPPRHAVSDLPIPEEYSPRVVHPSGSGDLLRRFSASGGQL